MTPSIAQIRTVSGSSVAVGWAGLHALTIDRPAQAGGQGMGYSGGELLLLAIGACYYNDLHREAALRAIAIHSVQIEVQCVWAGDPPYAQQIEVSASVKADASEAAIYELIQRIDRIAEVPNTLRMGAAVTLVPAPPAPQPSAPAAPYADALLEMLGIAERPGGTCALLTPTIKTRLRELPGGAVLEMRADDASAHADIAAWCRLSGHELLATHDEMPRFTRYFIRKKHS